jgi:DNA-directed RNA polymerase subunit RPC12/RpoP
MEYRTQILLLRCGNCGASLEISNELNQFACGYCGTEQIVERKGGTVALKPITDAIARIQTSTDKTAAELALRRLPQESNKLLWQRSQREALGNKQVADRRASAVSSVEKVIFASLVLVPVSAVFCSSTAGPGNGAAAAMIGAVIGLGVGICLIVLVYKRDSQTRDSDIQQIVGHLNNDLGWYDQQIKDISQRIEQNRVIANS